MKVSPLVLLPLVFVSGCAQLSPQVPSERLGGTSWQFVRFQGADGTVLTPDERAKYTIAFADDAKGTRN